MPSLSPSRPGRYPGSPIYSGATPAAFAAAQVGKYIDDSSESWPRDGRSTTSVVEEPDSPSKTVVVVVAVELVVLVDVMELVVGTEEVGVGSIFDPEPDSGLSRRSSRIMRMSATTPVTIKLMMTFAR